jgi:UPF0716 protein FxsA
MFALLSVLFFVIPIVELAVILVVGREIGALPTIGLLVLSGVVGAWLAKREGAGAWRRFNKALNVRRGAHAGSRLPHRRARHPAPAPAHPGGRPPDHPA